MFADFLILLKIMRINFVFSLDWLLENFLYSLKNNEIHLTILWKSILSKFRIATSFIRKILNLQTESHIFLYI